MCLSLSHSDFCSSSRALGPSWCLNFTESQAYKCISGIQICKHRRKELDMRKRENLMVFTSAHWLKEGLDSEQRNV